MSAFTPGPWKTFDTTGKPVNDPSVTSAKHVLATVWINDLSRKEAVANTVLMAAAPEMLAALRMVRAALYDTGRLEREGGTHEAVEAAIAAAEGRS